MTPFIGPSYSLADPKTERQRTVNLHLVGLDTPGKAPFRLDSWPGYVVFSTLAGEVRGGIEIGERAFAVAGATLYEVFSHGGATARGTLNTSAGPVSMAFGLTQLVIVDGGGYVFTLASNAFAAISDTDFPGADTVDFIDNYFVLTRDRAGQQYNITAINDATNLDALDFASSESHPDQLVCHVVVQAGILFFGTHSCELHINTGGADFPFERSRGSGFRVGLMARASLVEVDNACMWIGRDQHGAGMVYRLEGGQPRRVSTEPLEQALQGSTDLSAASAYSLQIGGLTFYVIQAPGLKTTPVYSVASGSWTDLADLDDLGQFKADRGTCHFYAFGHHLIGGSDGIIYRLDRTVYLKGTDPLVRERISPHGVSPGRKRIFFDAFILDCSTGGAGQGIVPQAELSWADYKLGPAAFCNSVLRSCGEVGQEFARVVWRRLGFSRDRVWKLRFSANAPFSINAVDIAASEGTE